MQHRERDRRRRFVYVTKNTEYHVLASADGDGGPEPRRAVCVGVRDRHSGAWLAAHPAVARRLEGGVRLLPNGAALPSLKAPEIGDAMYFVLEDEEEDDRQIVTSRLESIARPAIADLVRYPAA